jgi:hypothetical protein
MKVEPKTATLRVRCAPSEKSFIRTFAEKLGVNESTAVRIAIRRLRKSPLIAA